MKHQCLATSVLTMAALFLSACNEGESVASSDQSGGVSTAASSGQPGGVSPAASSSESGQMSAGGDPSGVPFASASSSQTNNPATGQTGQVSVGRASSGQTGWLSLGVTDAPLDDLRSVVVQFSGVAFKRVGGETELITTLSPSPQAIDLLQFRDGNTSTLLANVPMPAGEYQWIRLIVDSEPNVRDSFVVLHDGSECELRVPSGAQSGLKLIGGFTLPADGTLALTVDFDLRKSIHAPPGQKGNGVNCTQGYLMRPVLRIVDNANVGAIAGRIATSLITPTCKPAVYVYQGMNVTPDDIEETSATTPDVDPYATTVVNVIPGTQYQQYQLSFIPPGDYTVAFTCSSDDPTDDETLTFVQPQSTTVQANQVSIVDFLDFGK